MHKLTIAAAVGCLAIAVTAADASPITTPPPPVMGLGGNVQAVFVYASANDSSKMMFGSTTMFCNHAISGSCGAASPGDTISLGVQSGPMTFTLNDTTTGRIYDTTSMDAFGDYHADIRTAYTFSGVPTMSASLAAYLATMPNVTFIAFEDRDKGNNSDFDYNDLIFAISAGTALHNVPPPVPEPLTLSLVGAGLLGAFGLRKRKKAGKKA